MTEIVRRINLLTVLALLLSGLLQPLAAAQGVTCARTHLPAQEAAQSGRSAIDGSAIGHESPRILSAPHVHGSMPRSGAATASSGPCGVSAFLSEQRLPSPAMTARPLLHVGELPPARLFIRSLFRPPRLS